jgi:hypothetical protein
MRDELKVADFHASVHIAGSGFGEGVIVEVGSKVVVLMDCNKIFVAPGASRSSYLEALLGAMPDAAVYWILSHMHFDHFQAFSAGLAAHNGRVRRVIVPVEYTQADVMYVASQQLEESTRSKAMARMCRGEYQRLRELLRAPPIGDKVCFAGGGPWRVVDIDLVHPSRKPKRLTIDLFGVGHGLHEQLLGHAVLGATDREADRAHANDGCYVVSIFLGDVGFLLLGDAPVAAVKRIWRQQFVGERRLCVMKVAHHGSRTGWDDELAGLVKLALIDRYQRVAMVAPYSAKSLPVDDIIASIERAGLNVLRSDERFSGHRTEAAIGETRIAMSTFHAFGEPRVVKFEF